MKSLLRAAPLLLLSTSAFAQVATPPRPVTDPATLSSPVDRAAAPAPIEDLVFSRDVLDADWSADGKAVFLATNLTGRYNIWRVDAQGSWPVQITQSDEMQRGLALAPDGASLYYLQDTGGDEYHDVYAVPTGGGAPRNLTASADVDERNLLVSPDSQQLALTTKAKGAGQTDLAVLDLAAGHVRALTHETNPQWGWTPVAWVDGGRALIANRRYTDYSAGEVWRIEVASGKATRLLGKAGTTYRASGATADGSRIAITTNAETGQEHAGVLTTSDGALHLLTPTPWEQESGAITPDGTTMLAQTNTDGRIAMVRVDLATLAETPIALPAGVSAAQGTQPFTPDSQHLLLSHSSASTPGELYVTDLASGTSRQLTHLAMASIDPAHMPKSEVVTYASFDGTLVSALVVMPANLARDGSNPAIVFPHGGPTGQTKDSFDAYKAALAGAGYIVIAPNPRGSTGYGEAFQKANYQDLGGGDLKDELAARQFLIDSGYVDPAKVGITGGSYGGFMTLMAIGRAPEAFAAAVERYGIIDWRTMWEHEDARLQAYQESILGRPEETEVYARTSPLTYIAKARAPLLVQHGENDIRVPIGQTGQIIAALEKSGTPVELIRYPEEGHGFYRREHRMDSISTMVAWFDTYLK